MGEPIFRKPIFGAFWRYPEVDLQPLQRVGRRGVLRLALLVPLTLTLVSLLAISVVYATSGILLGDAILIGFVLASVTVLVLRGWMLGTFVNARGFKVVRMLQTQSGHWESDYTVQTLKTTWRALGIPIGVASQRVVLIPPTGAQIDTHVYIGSVDAVFTRERFDILFQLLRRWSTPE